MSRSADSALASLQEEIPLLMGKCILRLQNYERFLKALVDESAFSRPIGKPDESLADNDNAQRLRTLGMLVGEFVGGTISSVTSEAKPGKETEPDRPENWVDFRFVLKLPDEEFARVADGLRDLVALRNGLVHTFINEHDMSTVEGCTAARDALLDALARIATHLEALRGWMNAFVNARQTLADFVKSDAFWAIVQTGQSFEGTFPLGPPGRATD